MTQMVEVTLLVNGISYVLEVEPRWLLSDVLRHRLGGAADLVIGGNLVLRRTGMLFVPR